MQRKHMIALGAAAVVLVASSAAAGAFIIQNMDKPPERAAVHQVSQKESIHWNQQARAQQPQPQKVACDDNNIVGTAVGGLVGGVAGSQVGHGNGKTAATIGGTLGGAYLGNQFIPARNATCR